MTKEFCPKNYINTNCTFECSCEECPITQNDVNVNIKQIHKMDNAKEKFELCDCGQIAKWLYVSGFKNNSNPFFCDDCVPRGCDCNYIYEANFTSKEEYENHKSTLPLNPDNELIPDKTLLSLQKRVDFLSKELKVGKEVLHKHAFPVPRLGETSSQSTFATAQGNAPLTQTQDTPKTSSLAQTTPQVKSVKNART